MTRVKSRFEPLPAQWAFFQSTARIRGYGGAMGGGKSRCLMEWVFDLSLRYPGLRTLVARQTHTSIIETTKKTFYEEVLPPEVLQVSRTKESGGEDWIRFPNGSQVNFVGLDDPVRWFSSELGLLVFDEAHEITEDTIVKLMTRLRQKGMPHLVALGFNPENPGHFLFRWFMLGSTKTQYGYAKEALYTKDAELPAGSAEFILAKATENIHLPARYIEDNLASMPQLLRRRYLDGEWLFTSGAGFFDVEAMDYYATEMCIEPQIHGRTEGDPTRENLKDPPRFRKTPGGAWQVWKTPVRASNSAQHKPSACEACKEQGEHRHDMHRYVVAVDVAQGSANDYSAVQVLCVETWEQVAEYQFQLEPALLALEVARIGWIYNEATVAVETTGGWGGAVIADLERLRYRRLYTRRKVDRISKAWTDVLGWDTNTRTRADMLDVLERVVRERELGLRSVRTLNEMSTFVWPEDNKTQDGPFKGIPAAQPNCNDDLVMALAIGVQVMVKLPRTLRRPKRDNRAPLLVTGYR